MALTIENIKRGRDAGLDDDKILSAIESKYPELSEKFNAGRNAGLDNKRILSALEHKLSSEPYDTPSNNVDGSIPPQNASNEPSGNEIPTDTQQQPEKTQSPGILQSFEAGVMESSAGELTKLLNGTLTNEKHVDRDFIDTLSHSFGNVVGSLPAFIAGGLAGGAAGTAVAGPAGGVAGAGVGAMGLEALIKETLKEIREHRKTGEDMTLEEFWKRAENVSGSTLREGAMGGTLAAVNKSLPLLKQIPWLNKLLETKIGGKAATIGAEIATAGTVPAISEGRLPTVNEYANAAALITGLHLPRLLRIKIAKEGKESGLSPEEYAKLKKQDILNEAMKAEMEKASELLKEQTEKKYAALKDQMDRKESEKTKKEQSVESAVESAKKEPKTTTKDLKDINATILLSTDTAKARNMTDKINVETTNSDLLRREPEKVDKTGKQVTEDLQTINEFVENAPRSNKKKLAEKAIENGWVRTPQQLSDFIEYYQENYSKIGKAGLSTNRKFMNQFEKDHVTKREIKPIENAKPIDIKPTAERQLEIARNQKREARLSGDKQKEKDAQKRIDLAKKRIQRESNQKINETSEIPSEQPKAEANQKTETSKENVNQSVNQPANKPKKASFSVKPSAFKLTRSKKKKPIKKKKTSIEKVPKPITEETGQSAFDRMEPEPSLKGRVKEAGKSVAEAVKNPSEALHEVYTKTYDALEPLNRLETDIPTEERVTTKIKQAMNAASDINNVLSKGAFDNNSDRFASGSLQEVYTGVGDVWQKTTKGLKPQEYSVQELDAYRLSKEALKRQKKGLKSGIGTKEATETVEKLKQKYGPIDQRLREFQKKITDHYATDMLTPEAREQWNQESHASLYRVMDYGNDAVVSEGSLNPKKWWHRAKGSLRKILPPSESDIQNISMMVMNSKKNQSILQYKKFVESGQLPGKIVKSKNRALPEHMMEDLDIDPEYTEMAETIYNQSRKDAFTPETRRIRGWENGKPFEIEVPRDVYETYASLAPADTGTFTKIFRSTNNLMSRAIVFEPIKAGSIFLRDAYSSLIYSKTGSNPISIVKALVDIYKDSHSWNQFKSLGGEQYATRLMTRSDRIGKIEELLKSDRPNAVMVPFNKLSGFLKKFSSSLTASVPFAEYQRSVKKFGDTPSGRLQALIESKSVTYDPTKRGSSKLVRDAANFLPFFNVMLQEPAMIAKHMKSPQFWAKGAVGLTMPAMLLHMYNEGNPDYDDMNPLLKASCFHFYSEDGHYACPLPWLLGALFVSTPITFYEFAKGRGGDALKGLNSFVASQLSGSFPPILQATVEQSTNYSLPTPTGVALMPFTDIEKRAPPVVPKRLENLPPEQQYTSKTSQLARWYGDLTGASPVKVERLIKTFVPGIGADVLAIADEMAYFMGLAEDLRPEQGAKNFLLCGKFLSENTPSNTKYTGEFYSLLEKAANDDKRDLPNDYKQLKKSNMKISKLLRQYREIEDERIDPKDKREQLIDLQKQINVEYKSAVLSTKE